MVVSELVEREQAAAVDLRRLPDEVVRTGREQVRDGAVEAACGERPLLARSRAESGTPEKPLGLGRSKMTRVHGRRHSTIVGCEAGFGSIARTGESCRRSRQRRLARRGQARLNRSVSTRNSSTIAGVSVGFALADRGEEVVRRRALADSVEVLALEGPLRRLARRPLDVGRGEEVARRDELADVDGLVGDLADVALPDHLARASASGGPTGST